MQIRTAQEYTDATPGLVMKHKYVRKDSEMMTTT